MQMSICPRIPLLPLDSQIHNTFPLPPHSFSSSSSFRCKSHTRKTLPAPPPPDLCVWMRETLGLSSSLCCCFFAVALQENRKTSDALSHAERTTANAHVNANGMQFNSQLWNRPTAIFSLHPATGIFAWERKCCNLAHAILFKRWNVQCLKLRSVQLNKTSPSNGNSRGWLGGGSTTKKATTNTHASTTLTDLKGP